MRYSGFQSNAWQSSAYQIVPGITIVQKGGGGRVDHTNSYEQSKAKYLKEKIEKERLEHEAKLKQEQIDATNAKIERIEAQRLQDLTNTKLQLQLVRLAKEAEEERQQLAYIQSLIEQIELIWRREEDEIAVLLYCLPFC